MSHPKSQSQLRRGATGKTNIGMIHYDQINGLGAHVDNRDVFEKGFVAFMKPTDFLMLVRRIKKERVKDGQTHHQFVMKHLRDKKAIGAPRLYLDVQEGKVTVISHEGRHRVTSITKIQPKKNIMVHCIIRKSSVGAGAYSNLGITPKMLRQLDSTTTPQKGFPAGMRSVRVFRHILWKNRHGDIINAVG